VQEGSGSNRLARTAEVYAVALANKNVVPDKAIVVVFTDLISITSADLVAKRDPFPLVMPGPTPHRTPLRRVSQGSLFALSRSGAHSEVPHGLGFLAPALAELADEAEALRANVDGLRALSASLDTFNESFASWLYVMNMNALTVEWPEVSVLFFLHLFFVFFFLKCVWVSGLLLSTFLVNTGTDGSVFHPC
jgi:hypothetical protein